MIVVSSVNGRNVDNAEGPLNREMIKILETERGEGPPSDPQNEIQPETTEGPTTIDTSEEAVPIETTQDPELSDEIPEGNYDIL